MSVHILLLFNLMVSNLMTLVLKWLF